MVFGPVESCRRRPTRPVASIRSGPAVSSPVTSSPRPPACRCLPDLSGQLRAPCPRQRHGRPLGSIRERTAYYSSLCWLRSVSAAAAGAAIPLPSSIVLVRPSIGIVTTQALSLAWETCTFAAHQLQPPCSLCILRPVKAFCAAEQGGDASSILLW